MKSLSELRKEYKLGRLTEDDLTTHPIELFKHWFHEIVDSGLPDPNAMTVATVDEFGVPSQRIVLLKDLSSEGFVFYTNLGSNKAKNIERNANVSLHFPWHVFERQVKIVGTAEKLSRMEVAKYFLSRPKDSQIGAWASKQSQPIKTRALLLTQFSQAKGKFLNGEVPVPDFWGGYVVRPHLIEFWQGGEHRLHDRFEYRVQDDDTWSIQRLMP